jgi:hypothetical protein
MSPSERFLRFAAECESMAKRSKSPQDKPFWRQLAERWMRCAELAESKDRAASGRRKPPPRWAH